jgi:uncharacterized protein (DUF1800 family)
VTTTTADLDAAVAATRFGLGARPGEIAAARGDPRGRLKAQIVKSGADQPQGDLAPGPERLASFFAFEEERNAAKMAAAQMAQSPSMSSAAPPPKPKMAGAQAIGETDEFAARVQLATQTDAPFRERWALFWMNHFTVSATKGVTGALAGPFEREAIRPHVFGRFEDLLMASSHHPAMLFYLDQERSVGPDSPVGVRKHMGLNENLAREIMELHTVGLEAGYAQADVTEFAKALTGWIVPGRNAPPDQLGRFQFRDDFHEPGERTIMGRRYSQQGQDQAEAVLKDLAGSPHTARHVAHKLAVHFVADDPPAALTARLEHAFTAHGGDLAEVARTLIDSPEAWDPQARKMKSPYEFLVSSYRAVGASPQGYGEVAATLMMLGERPYTAPSPKGWPEDSAAWSAPDAVVKRIGWAQGFAQRQALAGDPVELAQNALGARLTPAAAAAISRAQSRPEALAILIMSPEFQRR